MTADKTKRPLRKSIPVKQCTHQGMQVLLKGMWRMKCLFTSMVLGSAVLLFIANSSLSAIELPTRMSIANAPIVQKKEHEPFPHILHFLWPTKDFSFGEEDPNGMEQRRTRALVQVIIDANPEWEIKVWTDEECHAFIREHFPEFYPYWSSLSPKLKLWDAVRPAILYVHGGIYLDHDIDCDEGVHFSDWIGPHTTLLLREPSLVRKQRLGNHFMGSAKGHPIWKLYLKNIMKEIPENFTVTRHTGPKQLYATFKEYAVNLMEADWDQIRLLEENELDDPGGCRKAKKYAGYCHKPRCTHRRAISPAELQGEDDDSMSQIKKFRRNIAHENFNQVKKTLRHKYGIAHNYTEARGSCEYLTSFAHTLGNDNKEEESPQVVFIHIPETGGAMIERLLNVTTTCHATASVLQDCDHDSYSRSLSFSVLQNPIKRALSMYQYARARENSIIEDEERFGWAKGLDFAEFVEMLPAQGDYFFAPQAHFVNDHFGQASLLVDEILCAEDLDTGWRRIQAFVPRLKMYGELLAEPIGTSSRSRKFGISGVNESSVERLKEIYHNDFLLWEEHCSASIFAQDENYGLNLANHDDLANQSKKRHPANSILDCDGEGSPCNYFYPALFYDSPSSLGYSKRDAAHRQLYGSPNRTFHANWVHFTSNFTSNMQLPLDFTYIHIRKSGGTSIMSTKRELEKSEVKVDGMWTNRVKILYERLGEKEFIQTLKTMVNSTTFFTFVRDPVSRFCSAMGQIAFKHSERVSLEERGCLTGSAVSDMSCVLEHLKMGDLVNEHLMPASIELYQMMFSLSHVRVAVMPMKHLNSFMKACLHVKPIYANAKDDDLVKQKYKVSLLNHTMIHDICNIYEADVQMMQSLGMRVPHCMNS